MSFIHTVSIGFIHSLITANEDFHLIQFATSMMWALLFYTVSFAVLEKVKKENYVIGLTNSMTKKILLTLLN